MNEQLSAWVDGELDAADSGRVLARLGQDAALRERCDVAWLIGDALRQQPSLSPAFSDKVMAALANEPTVLAPLHIKQMPAQGNAIAERPARTSAWMAMAAAVAGISVVAALGWSFDGGTPGKGAVSAQVASVENGAQQTQIGQVTERVGLNDDRAYMVAHQSYGARAALPSVASYVLTVGHESESGAR